MGEKMFGFDVIGRRGGPHLSYSLSMREGYAAEGVGRWKGKLSRGYGNPEDLAQEMERLALVIERALAGDGEAEREMNTLVYEYGGGRARDEYQRRAREEAERYDTFPHAGMVWIAGTAYDDFSSTGFAPGRAFSSRADAERYAPGAPVLPHIDELDSTHERFPLIIIGFEVRGTPPNDS